MRRSYKFLLRPTSKQAAALPTCLEDHRQSYNAALEHRRTAYRKAGVTIRYGDQSAELKHIRADDPDGQGRWSFSSQQATLRRLDKAFAAFFARVKAGRTPGFPRFKGRGWFDTVTWPKDGDGCRWDSQPEHPTATFVRLQGIGHVRVHQHRPVKGRVKTISVKREGRRWYVILACDDVPAKPLPAAGAVAGIDLGVASFVTTSDGAHVANPRHLTATADRLAALGADQRRGGLGRLGGLSLLGLLLGRLGLGAGLAAGLALGLSGLGGPGARRRGSSRRASRRASSRGRRSRRAPC